jgi:hypothetical protein
MSPRAIIVMVLFLSCEGALFAAYWLLPAYQDLIKFFATVLAAAFALFEFLQKTQHDRYESAGEFIKRWNDPSLNEIRLAIRAILTDALLLEPLIKKSLRPDQFNADQAKERGKVIGALNFFEELAIAVRRKRADERYLYDFFSATVQEVWNKFRAWIDADRTFGDQSYWCEFEELKKRWAKKLPWWV